VITIAGAIAAANVGGVTTVAKGVDVNRHAHALSHALLHTSTHPRTHAHAHATLGSGLAAQQQHGDLR
jgi:hypothetical protein